MSGTTLYKKGAKWFRKNAFGAGFVTALPFLILSGFYGNNGIQILGVSLTLTYVSVFALPLIAVALGVWNKITTNPHKLKTTTNFLLGYGSLIAILFGFMASKSYFGL